MANVRLVVAWTLTGLLAGFLVLDAALHLLKLAPAVEASEKAGWATAPLPLVGAVEAVALVLYLVPRTARLGAVLFTGYLGGASALNLMTGQGWFATLFAPAFGVLLWAALALRDPGALEALGLAGPSSPAKGTATPSR